MFRTVLTGLAMILLGNGISRAFERDDPVGATLLIFVIILVAAGWVVDEVDL